MKAQLLKRTGATLLTLSALTLASHQLHAAPISYNGYSYSGSGNTFTGGGLEWLRWSETSKISYNEAISTYGAQGYRLATYEQGVALANALLPNKPLANSTDYLGKDDANIFDIVTDAKVDYASTPNSSPLHLFSYSTDLVALFAANPNEKGQISSFMYLANYEGTYRNPVAGKRTSVKMIQNQTPPSSYYDLNPQNFPSPIQNYGLMLVRDLPTAVSEPTSIALFGLGLAGLGFVQRRKKA